MEFFDVREILPNHKDLVLFLVGSDIFEDNELPLQNDFLILNGEFLFNKNHDIWVFRNLVDYKEFNKGYVFKWTYLPEFKIDISEYPKGTEVPLKYQRFLSSPFEQRFFCQINTLRYLNQTEEQKKENVPRVLNRIPLCKCGKESTGSFIEKTVQLVEYPVERSVPVCPECDPRQVT